MRYVAIFTPDKEVGGFVVNFPDVPGVHTEGDTFEQAMDMAEDALALGLTFWIDRGEALPVAATKAKGKTMHEVEVPTLAAIKLNLYSAFLESGLRKADFARKIGISKTNVDRLFDVTQNTRLELLDEAFRVLGKRLRVSVEAA